MGFHSAILKPTLKGFHFGIQMGFHWKIPRNSQTVIPKSSHWEIPRNSQTVIPKSSHWEILKHLETSSKTQKGSQRMILRVIHFYSQKGFHWPMERGSDFLTDFH